MADDNRTQQVSLGCGTLILIALIVLLFSGGGVDEVKREIESLRSEIVQLKNAVASQTGEISTLRRTLERLNPRTPGDGGPKDDGPKREK